jgi:Polyketide cyclase / dehydrase and lipid transport
MATLELRACGSASADTAWERYAEPARWSGWAPQIQRVDTAMQRLTAGGTGTVRAGLLPLPTLPVPFEVLDVDETARTWSWRASLGPVRLHLVHGVEAHENGSSTWLRVRGPFPVVAAYAPLARFALGRLVAQ